jgi:hypothetical protein
MGAGAVFAWWLALPLVDLGRMDDFGLISALPATFLIGPALLHVTFALALRLRPVPELLLGSLTIALIIMLYALPTLLYDAPRVSITWLHAGFADLIARTGELPTIDARFDWPIFFVVAAVVSTVAGLENPIDLAAAVPPLLNVLYLGPLLMIFGSSTSDRRLVWMAIWLFYLANWVGQDYFSPQGFNYVFYLAILGILLRWFRPPATERGWLDRIVGSYGVGARSDAEIADDAVADGANRNSLTGKQRAGLVAVLILIFAAVVSSHQLTPFALVAGVTALVAFKRSTLRGMPVLMAVMLGTWISYMTVSFLSGHLESLFANLGEAQNVAQANVAARLAGSAPHVLVVQGRILFTIMLWATAAIGGLRRLRHGYWDLSFVLLALIPFGLVFLHGYGGELLLRVYLFSLPFVAFFAAAAFYPSPMRAGLAKSTVIVAATSLLLVGFLLARYGNDRADMMTGGEVTAVETAYRQMETDSTIATANYNSPVGYQRYEDFNYVRVTNGVLTGDIELIIDTMRYAAKEHAYLVLTRGQQATAEMFYGMPRGAWDTLLDDLRRSSSFRVVVANDDALVLELLPVPHSG